MSNSTEELEKHVERRITEDSEYVRLVISDEERTAEASILQPQGERKTKPVLWWVKALVWCIITIIFLLVFAKWGVPFLFQKVVLSFPHRLTLLNTTLFYLGRLGVFGNIMKYPCETYSSIPTF